MSRPRRIEPVMFGASGSGKSSIARQFCYSRFNETSDPMGEPYRKEIRVDKRRCVVELIDTNSNEEYKAMEEHMIQAGDGYILVYSITSRASFEEIRAIHSRIQKVRETCRPDVYSNISISTWKSGSMYLVANKLDLDAHREVSTQEGRELAEELDIEFVELSATNTEAVDKLAEDSARAIMKYQIQLDQAQSALARQTTEATLEATSSQEEKRHKRKLSTIIRSSLVRISSFRSSKRQPVYANA